LEYDFKGLEKQWNNYQRHNMYRMLSFRNNKRYEVVMGKFGQRNQNQCGERLLYTYDFGLCEKFYMLTIFEILQHLCHNLYRTP